MLMQLYYLNKFESHEFEADGPVSMGEFHPKTFHAFIPSPLTQFVFPPAYQAELRQRGSDSSLLILQLYFSISMECLPLFSQCFVTAGMPVLVARVGLGRGVKMITHATPCPPSQLPAEKPGYGH